MKWHEWVCSLPSLLRRKAMSLISPKVDNLNLSVRKGSPDLSYEVGWFEYFRGRLIAGKTSKNIIINKEGCYLNLSWGKREGDGCLASPHSTSECLGSEPDSSFLPMQALEVSSDRATVGFLPPCGTPGLRSHPMPSLCCRAGIWEWTSIWELFLPRFVCLSNK